MSEVCPHCGDKIPDDEWCCDESMEESMARAAATWWEDE